MAWAAKGVRLYGRDFVESFSCLFAEFSRLAVYDVGFALPDGGFTPEETPTPEYEALRSLSYDGAVDADSGLFKPGFFPTYAENVSNDWNRLILLKPRNWTRGELARALEEPTAGTSTYLKHHRLARAHVEALGPVALLQNWDGGYWQLFTPRKDWINRVVRQARAGNARWLMVDFETEYPDPSDVALKRVLAEEP